MTGRRLLVLLFWMVFGVPFFTLMIALFALALFPGTILAWVTCGEAEQAWIICAPLMNLADALTSWAEGD